MKTLIVYSSKHGFTEKAAEKLKEKLKGTVEIINLDKGFSGALDEYEKIIIGSAIYVGKIRNSIMNFIKENINQFQGKKVGVFLCGREENYNEEQIKSFFPEEFYENICVKGHFGYGVDFNKMNFIEKAATKKIMKINQTEICFNEKNISKFAETFNAL